MKIKLAAAVVALVALPAAGYAMCSDRSHQAMSCSDGAVWDASSQSCVKQVTG